MRGVGDELAQVLFGLLRSAPRTRAGRRTRAWIRSSITLSARASRPTSVDCSAPGTRWSRLPAAMESAVRSTSSSGRRPRRTSHQPAASANTSAPAVTASSIRKRVCRVLVWSTSVCACTRTSPLKVPPWTVWARTRKDGPPGAMDAGGEVGHVRAVGLRREPADLCRQLRPVRVVAHIGGALEAVHDAAALLDHGDVADAEDVGEVTARAAPPPPGPPPLPTGPAAVVALRRRAHDVAGDRIDVEMDGALQLLVDLVVERRAQRRVGGEVGDDQRHDARWLRPRAGVGAGGTLRLLRWRTRARAACSRPGGWCG